MGLAQLTSTVSSQVSHDFHGVAPPAQLVLVPDRAPEDADRARVARVELDDGVAAAGAGVVGDVARARRPGRGAPHLVVADQADLAAPAKAAMPSWAGGVGRPSDIVRADLAERPVLEALGQGQQLVAGGVVGRRGDGAVASVAPWPMPWPRRARPAPRAADANAWSGPARASPPRSGGRGLEERTSIDVDIGPPAGRGCGRNVTMVGNSEV